MRIENSLDVVFDDEGAGYGLVVTEVETIIGFGIAFVIPPEGVADYFTVDTTAFPAGEDNAIIHAIGVTDTVGYNYVKIFDTPGCRKSSRDYSRQYESASVRDPRVVFSTPL